MAASAFLDWVSGRLAPPVAAPDRPASPRGPGAEAVMGYAVGYDVADVAPFVRSLRSVFTGQVILFVDRRPALLAWLAGQGVEAIVAEDRLLHWSPHPVVARFAVYAQILQSRPGLGQVILSDVRDVIFQGDPFAGGLDSLQFFTEADGSTLAEHPFNMKHLRALVGDRLARDVSRRDCVCVGVVAGPSAQVLRFCRTVLLLCAIPRSHVGGAFGADQAACNVIAHLDLAGGEIHPNYRRVATLGLTAAPALACEDGLIVNPDGSLSPIVHQYDRIPALADLVDRRWGEGGGSPPRRRKTIRQRLTTLRTSVMRRLPELR